ncbi:Ulp1 protease family, C-terminal catalytic domain containing protein [Parasponia andersonii]|uniref:Ulp1 protease family, C-terminal catalytic domain containing protein n=1 Tax=Parasponia andersonii TaxID=3476 RepID=A0A2P5DDX1_PARAD|nr:Ulp1 protease family, C-terminal catalytic domain containing protein [Parasponia andersonii]
MDLMKKEIFHRQDLIKGSIDSMKKDFSTKFDALLTLLTKCREKLGIDVVSSLARLVNEKENKEATPLVDEADKNSKVNDENKADVFDVYIIPDFILDDYLLEGIDSVNDHKDYMKDGDKEGKNTEESKEEEKEDKQDDNDDKDEDNPEENDKDDKDDPDKGASKAIDKFTSDGKEDEIDDSDNIIDKGADNSSKDGNKENIDICDPIAEKKDLNLSSEFYSNKKPTDPLEVYMVERLPDDCAIFVIAFTEYFIHGTLDELKKNFQVQNYRNKLSVELYMHGRKKQIEGYESELDFKGYFSKKMKNTKT